MKLKYFFIIVFLSGFVMSCGSKKRVVKNKQRVVKQDKSVKNLPSVNQKKHVKKLTKKSTSLNKHTLSYIKIYAPLAVMNMHEYKIPASITLAQGILESGNGRSTLASKSNNHFGIKCHKGWTGMRVYHDDDKAQECFRKYRYVSSSYADHSKFLTTRRRYAFLFKIKKTNYKAWAKGLKKAGYATDRKYPQKLIKIIKDYKLHEFDSFKKRDFKKLKKSQKKFTEPTDVRVVVAKKATRKSTAKNVYVVKKGDTLYAIARKNNISITTLKKLNKLKGNVISIGQKLKLRK